MAGQDVGAEVLAYQFGAGGGKLGAHVGGARVQRGELLAQLAHILYGNCISIFRASVANASKLL